MYKLLRPLFFSFSPEVIHHFMVALLRFTAYLPGIPWLLRKIFVVKHPSLKKEILGLHFNNPIGLAAGFDKNAEVYNELSNLGFGFIEVGTITPLPQAGNPKPRCFRLPEDQAIINRMGFNNMGLEAAVQQLKKKRKEGLIIGGNIGKNTATPNEKAVNDYVKCFKGLYDYVDYFVINVSCPNIGNLQKLQNKDELELILRSITEERRYQDVYKPILLKISPDLSFEQIDDTLYLIREIGIDGIVATNTSTSRTGLKTNAEEVKSIANGGLSGQPLTKRSLAIVRHISEQTAGQLPIIGVGGIMTTEDALNMLNAGASLIQLYTGFIYQGPGFAKQVAKKIVKVGI